jgi:cyclically-permuted mutarotase family protein
MGLFSMLFIGVGCVRTSDVRIKFSELPPLPPAPGQQKQIGVAGPFAGVHNNALIVAGGANYPDGYPWKSGKNKVWWDDIFVGQKKGGKFQWLDKSFKLPRPLAYGVSVSTMDGIICIGGSDSKEVYSDVFTIKWDPVKEEIEIEEMPSLPNPMSFMVGAKAGTIIYVAGKKQSKKEGDLPKKVFLALDLSKKDNFKWQEIPVWPGPARSQALAAAQNNGTDACFYLFSGLDSASGRLTNLLTDAYKYNPKTGMWKKIAGIKPDEGKTRCLAAGVCIAAGDHYILFFGAYDAKKYLHDVERVIIEIEKSEDEAEKKRLEDALHALFEKSEGLSKDVLAYDTITDKWTTVTQMPGLPAITSLAVDWNNSIVIPSGEVRAFIRTPRILVATPFIK